MRLSRALLLILLFASLGCCRTGVTQSPVAPPGYDVVSVRVNNTLTQSNSTDVDADGFHAKNVTLKHLLVNAYGIREGLIYGLPGWASSLRFDVDAKTTDPDLKSLPSLSREQRRAMIASILVSRFHLKVHTESKILPMYELVVAKDGPKLTASPHPDPLGIGKMDVHNTDIVASQMTLSQLAGNLSFPLERTVIDKTGLAGQYDFHLRWTPETVVAYGLPTDAPPDLFSAIKEQLGLKLQPAKGPVETLVVDHVEQPTKN